METTNRKLNLLDFGMGVLGGLRLHQVNLLSDRDLPAFHGAFKEAHDSVAQNFGEKNMKFILILDQLHGTTPHADEITNYWLSSGYVTRDSPGSTIRLTGFGRTEARALLETIPGTEELWHTAADAFLRSFRGWI